MSDGDKGALQHTYECSDRMSLKGESVGLRCKGVTLNCAGAMGLN